MKETSPTPLSFTLLVPFFLTLLILILERTIGRNENILPIAPWFAVILLMAYIPMLLLFLPLTRIAYQIFQRRQWILFGGIALIPIIGMFVLSAVSGTLRDLPRSCRWTPTQQLIDAFDNEDRTPNRCV